MVGSLGWMELLLIAAVVVIFLGKGNQLPEITRALGEAVREFKDAANPNVHSSEPVDETTTDSPGESQERENSSGDNNSNPPSP